MQRETRDVSGFFATEIGRQWLDACLEIFDYCVKSMAHYFGNNTSLQHWKVQSKKIQNWNNVFVMRWMDQVVMPNFGHISIFWRKDKDSPLLVEYVYSTFESLTGTVSVQIPPMRDFLFCAFSVFMQKLIERSETSNPQKTLECINNYNQQLLFALKNDGRSVALDAVRIAFLRIVNPNIRVDTRPTNESISVIMNIRDETKDEESQYHHEKSLKIPNKPNKPIKSQSQSQNKIVDPKHGERRRVEEFFHAAQNRSHHSDVSNDRDSKSRSKSKSKHDSSPTNQKSKSVKSKSKHDTFSVDTFSRDKEK
jgi:hypothetical protein